MKRERYLLAINIKNFGVPKINDKQSIKNEIM